MDVRSSLSRNVFVMCVMCALWVRSRCPGEGIHRAVTLESVPRAHIADITARTRQYSALSVLLSSRLSALEFACATTEWRGWETDALELPRVSLVRELELALQG